MLRKTLIVDPEANPLLAKWVQDNPKLWPALVRDLLEGLLVSGDIPARLRVSVSPSPGVARLPADSEPGIADGAGGAERAAPQEEAPAVEAAPVPELEAAPAPTREAAPEAAAEAPVAETEVARPAVPEVAAVEAASSVAATAPAALDAPIPSAAPAVPSEAARAAALQALRSNGF